MLPSAVDDATEIRLFVRKLHFRENNNAISR